MDDRFKIPGTNTRVGLDGLIGLIPGVGDGLAMLFSLYIVFEARRLGLSFSTVMLMLWNIILDTVVGSIPALGDFFDFAFKANRRNMDIIRRNTGKKSAKLTDYTIVD